MAASSSSLAPRSQYSELSTRPSSTFSRAQTQGAEIKPSQVHELKLQTQKLQQQTLVLRTQLKRMEYQIHTKTSAINKTFEQASEKPQGSATIHANTIPNLRRNIESARNTLETLWEQIEATEADDRTSCIEELEEELKMTYCEYKRLAQGLQDRNNAVASYTRELQDAEHRAASRHIADLRAMIREARTENAVLRDKGNAYQLKIEKLNIEDRLADCQKTMRPNQDVIDEAQVEQTELTEKIGALDEELRQEAEDHAQNVAKLNDIIQSLKDKIASRLGGSTGKPPAT
jgi:chromosome segregation ATPase